MKHLTSYSDDIKKAIDDLRTGKLILVVRVQGNNCDGQLVALAEKTTHETVNFMIKHGRGLVVIVLTEARAKALDLRLAVSSTSDERVENFTVSVDHVSTTTGISAFERAATIQALINQESQPGDFRKPGHMFPIIAKEGGVISRSDYAEAAIDLTSFADSYPAAVTCHVLADDGKLANFEQLSDFGKRYGMHMITIHDITKHRFNHDTLVKREREEWLHTKYGVFRFILYTCRWTDRQYLVILKGEMNADQPVYLQIESDRCLIAQTLGILKSSDGTELELTMQKMASEDAGILIYIGGKTTELSMVSALSSYKNGDKPIEETDYGLSAQILRDLNIRQVYLRPVDMFNEINLLKGFGISVREYMSN